jgi:aspartate racemase
MSKQGRCLGLIGGLGPAATVYYYRGLIAAHAKAGFTPRMLIAHADVDHGRPMAEANDLDGRRAISTASSSSLQPAARR